MPKQHNSKTIKNLFKELERLGFQVQHKKSGAYVIKPPDKTKPIYTTHGTESSYHPIRRDFKKLYNIDITTI
jgi:DNA-binding transcriptional regulator YhcF (GntR family)